MDEKKTTTNLTGAREACKMNECLMIISENNLKLKLVWNSATYKSWRIIHDRLKKTFGQVSFALRKHLMCFRLLQNRIRKHRVIQMVKRCWLSNESGLYSNTFDISITFTTLRIWFERWDFFWIEWTTLLLVLNAADKVDVKRVKV